MRLVIIALTLVFQYADAAPVSGRVYQVVDGDTLLLADSANRQHRIHLLGIDAPEATQAFGPQAKARLSALSFGKQVTAECQRFNSGKRCMVFVEQKDIALEQLRAGMAWRSRPRASGHAAQGGEEYEQAEFDAKIHRRGLWRGKNPIPPWDWRHGASEN